MRHLMERVNIGSLLSHELMLLVVLMVSMPVSALALGFGTLALSSHLNQPLSANVPIILSASDDVGAVHVALASQKEYRQLGLQWQPELKHLKVILQAKQSAHPYISLRSVGVIYSPILSILLKADKTGRGTYYKHFQLLLDPAEAAAIQQRPTVIPLRPAPVYSESSASIAPTVAHADGWARVWRYGPVRVGDNLSEIAYRLRRDKRFSNRQVMLSLFEKNPRSFVDGDINQLKRGAWLTVPRGNVVKTYAGKAAMLKLSQLLTRQPIKQATPTPKSGRKPKPKARSAAQAVAAPIQKLAQELHYSGKISVNGASASRSKNAEASANTGFDKQFDAIHAEMMAGKLQMTDLGKTVSSLNQSVQGIKQDIHALKKDVAIIKIRTEQSHSESPENWQLALAALLAGLFGGLIATAFRKKPVATSAPVSSQDAATEKAATSDKTQTVLIADEAVQLLNRAEESLGKCEFDVAEQTLRQIDKLSPDSLRASALKAQLYHETDRHGERNDLINSISESADKQRWERFCQLLPSHVWNACFGGGASDGDARNDGGQS